MTDDAAFIAAIRARPQEDAARLVYADWLEENGRADEADYLRVVHALTTLPEEAPARKKLVRRLLAVADGIEEEWRDAVGRRFDVLLVGWLGGAMSAIISAVRRFTGADALDPIRPGQESNAVAMQRGVLREAAEAFLNGIEKQRFRRDRTVKSVYQIVPSREDAALPAGGD
jgi:uncharacterized protein (TIGR02996 family)